MKVELNTKVCPIITPDTYSTDFQYAIDEECWDDFTKLFCDIGADYIKDAIKETKDFAGCNVVVDRELHSPKFYNYETDWIDFYIYISDDLINTLKTERISEQFLRYILNYGSHSGFVSSYPTAEKDVIAALEDPKKFKFNLAIALFIMYEVEYKIDLESYQYDFLEEVADKASQNGYDYVEDDDTYEESAAKAVVKNLIEGKPVRESICEAKKKMIDLSKLEADLTDAAYDYMESEGFEQDEIKHYFNLKIKSNSEKITIDVGAELSYDGMMDLSDKLDAVLQQYDPDAYFEAEDPGLMTAVIYK